MEEAAFIVMIPLGAFAMISYIAFVIGKTRQERFRAESMREIHSRMLDRVGTSEDFINFIKSEEGRRYLESLTRPSQAGTSPAGKIIATTRTGIVIAFLSVGFAIVAALVGIEPRNNEPLIIGTLGLFLGLGFVISAVVSHKLSKAYGLMNPTQDVD